MQSAFRYAIVLHNSNDSGTRFKIDAEFDQIRPHDPYSFNKICKFRCLHLRFARECLFTLSLSTSLLLISYLLIHGHNILWQCLGLSLFYLFCMVSNQNFANQGKIGGKAFPTRTIEIDFISLRRISLTWRSHLEMAKSIGVLCERITLLSVVITAVNQLIPVQTIGDLLAINWPWNERTKATNCPLSAVHRKCHR